MFDNLNIRNADSKDVEFIFYLNNESSVRKNSYSSELIKLADHKKWFDNQLKNNGKYFYVFEVNEVRVGQVTFGLKQDHAVIGISISNQFRGKGFALKGLNLALTIYFRDNKLPVHAYIIKENIASVKLFEKVGFTLLKEVIEHDKDSFVYKKEGI